MSQELKEFYGYFKDYIDIYISNYCSDLDGIVDAMFSSDMNHKHADVNNPQVCNTEEEIELLLRKTVRYLKGLDDRCSHCGIPTHLKQIKINKDDKTKIDIPAGKVENGYIIFDEIDTDSKKEEKISKYFINCPKCKGNNVHGGWTLRCEDCRIDFTPNIRDPLKPWVFNEEETVIVSIDTKQELLDWALTIIENVDEGSSKNQSIKWIEAQQKWRSGYYANRVNIDDKQEVEEFKDKSDDYIKAVIKQASKILESRN